MTSPTHPKYSLAVLTTCKQRSKEHVLHMAFEISQQGEWHRFVRKVCSSRYFWKYSVQKPYLNEKRIRRMQIELNGNVPLILTVSTSRTGPTEWSCKYLKRAVGNKQPFFSAIYFAKTRPAKSCLYPVKEVSTDNILYDLHVWHLSCLFPAPTLDLCPLPNRDNHLCTTTDWKLQAQPKYCADFIGFSHCLRAIYKKVQKSFTFSESLFS